MSLLNDSWRQHLLWKWLQDNGDGCRQGCRGDRGLVFEYNVPDSSRFGTVACDEAEKNTSVEEMPNSRSLTVQLLGDITITVMIARGLIKLNRIPRGEFEITSLNEMYKVEGLLDVQLHEVGFARLDTASM